jgi:cAMP-dependent protein kinase regulator
LGAGSAPVAAAGDGFTPVVIKKDKESYDRIDVLFTDNFLFTSLTGAEKKAVADAMEEWRVPVEESIITEGEDGDFFYLVEEGTFKVHKLDDATGKTDMVFQYEAGGSFGELALMYNCPRTASVVAATAGVLWKLDRATFRHVIVAGNRSKAQFYESFLANMAVFQSLSPTQHAGIADGIRVVEFKKHETVFKQGDRGGNGRGGDSGERPLQFYMIEAGEVEVVRDGVPVNTLGPGDYFGEKALLEKGAARAATVVAQGPVRCAAVGADTFGRLLSGTCRQHFEAAIREYKTAEQVGTVR